jgi:hypothetical protein
MTISLTNIILFFLLVCIFSITFMFWEIYSKKKDLIYKDRFLHMLFHSSGFCIIIIIMVIIITNANWFQVFK